MQILIALLSVALCWSMPIDGVQHVNDLMVRSGFSLGLMLLVIYLSYDNWALQVAGIELLLIIINAFMVASWGYGDWLLAHYAAIQKAAFSIEILIVTRVFRYGICLYLGRVTSRLWLRTYRSGRV